MRSNYLSLLIIVFFAFNSFSFCQEKIKISDSTDEASSISFLYGKYIFTQNLNEKYFMTGLSFSEPIGKNFYIIPEVFLIFSEKSKRSWKFFSLFFRYKLINTKIFNLYPQSGLGIVFPRELFFFHYQIGLDAEICIFNGMKISFEYRYLPLFLNAHGNSILYAVSIVINY